MQGLGQLTLVNNNKQSVLFHVGQVWRHAPRLGHAPYMETHTRWGSDQCSSFTTAKCTFRAEVDAALKPGTARLCDAWAACKSLGRPGPVPPA